MNESAFVNDIIDRYITDEELKRLLITHSRMVAQKALSIARAYSGPESSPDLQFVCDAAMLHDIGIVKCDAPSIHCHGSLPYICHGIAGAEILRGEGLDERFARVCERHTGSGITRQDIITQHLPLPLGDYLPVTVEEKIICYADKFFSKSGDPTAEKTPERVEASMRRHGPDAFDRFLKLQKELCQNQ